MIYYICHGTPAFNLFAPVQLLGLPVLATVAPPTSFINHLPAHRLRLSAHRHRWDTVNDTRGTSPVMSYGYRNYVIGWSQTL